MFATFKLDLSGMEEDGFLFKSYYDVGKLIYDKQKSLVHESLDRYLSPEGRLQASQIEKEWFPTVNADVFLSHSHQDRDKAIMLAGYLQNMGISTFIDSCVWGYADDLLKEIDNIYCIQEKKPDGGRIYDYDTRNDSTAHVHMILNGALMKMMDSTECLMFMDTPNSLSASDLKNGKTNSAWIYSELLMSDLLRKRTIIRKSYNESVMHDGLSVEYDVDIKHLTKISFEEIKKVKLKGQRGKQALFEIYCMKNIK